MVYRIFTEKKRKFAAEAAALLSDINTLLQIKSVTALRIVNRYDAENITEELFRYAVKTVFSEPQLDDTYESLENDGAAVFAVDDPERRRGVARQLRASENAACKRIIGKLRAAVLCGDAAGVCAVLKKDKPRLRADVAHNAAEAVAILRSKSLIGGVDRIRNNHRRECD